MRKKYLSALLIGTLLLSAGTFQSCKDYDEDISGLTQRVEAVESLVNDLQSQIQKGAVITDVQKTDQGVVVTLSNGNSFELTNGADGKPGSVVTIGDNGNWIIDGVDTGKPSRGEKGEQGEPGTPGGDGSGSASVYYYPGVNGEENGYWVKVSVAADGTESKKVTDISWKVSGSGLTAIWDEGSLILDGVEGTDEPVVITLDADLRALIYEPEMVLDGNNAMEYIYIPYKPYSISEGTQGGMLVHQIQTAVGYEERTEKYTVKETTIQAQGWEFLNPTYTKEYHMDPTTAIVPEYTQQNLNVVSNDLDFVATQRGRAAASDPTAVFQDVEDGKMLVGLTMDGKKVKTQETVDRYDLGIFYPAVNDPKQITDLAIQAPLDEDETEVITSTFASVYASQIAVEAIAYENSSYANDYIIKTPQFETDKVVGPETVHKTPLEGGRHLYDDVKDAAEQSATVEIAYNNKGGINLNELVTTHVGANSQRSWNTQSTYAWTEDELKAHGMKYNFEQVRFTIGDNQTEQSQNHSILKKPNGEYGDTYIYPCGVKSNSDTDIIDSEADESLLGESIASVGRTPLIRVELTDTVNNRIVSVGYIKFKIVYPETPIETEPFDLGEYYYSCGEATKTIAWHAIEMKLLNAAGVVSEGGTSKETFDALYEIVKNADGSVTQWVKTDKQDVNGQPIYETASHVGVINELGDDGAETTDVLSWTLDRADFVQCVNDPTYPVVTETRYVKYTPKKYLGNSNFNKEPVYLPISIELRYPQAIMANKLAKYWYAENSMNESNDAIPVADRQFIHANVEVPNTTTDVKTADCDFYFEIDSRFELNKTGHSDLGQDYIGGTWPGADNVCWNRNENAPTFDIIPAAWNPAQSWNTDGNFSSFTDDKLAYYYYFALNNNNKRVPGTQYISGFDASGNPVYAQEEYILSVDNDTENNPVMLATDPANLGIDYEFMNTALYATPARGGSRTKIASLIYNLESGHTRKHGVWLQLENNAVAKDLLNVPEEWSGKNTDATAAAELLKATLDVTIGVAPFNEECGAYLPLQNPEFGTEILKPVYTNPGGPIAFEDARDGNTEGTKVNLADLVNFYDWRTLQFANNLDYYNYYVVSDITVNPEDIYTNISGEWKPLKDTSLDVEFHVVRNGAVVDNGYTTPVRSYPLAPAAGSNWNDIVDYYGQLTYTNNTGTVVTFDIKVPVKVVHKWSQETLVIWIDGTVNRTLHN